MGKPKIEGIFCIFLNLLFSMYALKLYKNWCADNFIVSLLNLF